MREGLTVVRLPGYYGATRVGWLRRLAGDAWILLPGWCSIWRSSGSRLLEHLAADGPASDHRMSPPSKIFGEVSALLWVPYNAVIKAWTDDMPRPKNWMTWRADYDAECRAQEAE